MSFILPKKKKKKKNLSCLQHSIKYCLTLLIMQQNLMTSCYCRYLLLIYFVEYCFKFLISFGLGFLEVEENV